MFKAYCVTMNGKRTYGRKSVNDAVTRFYRVMQ